MLLSNALLLSSYLLCVSSLSTDNIKSVFGATASDLTGASIVLPQFTLSVVTNTTHALFNLNATSSKLFQVGWMGTGVGSAMVNADFLLVWPNPAPLTGSSSPWTLSHRVAVGENQPRPATAPPVTTQFFTFLPELSSSQTSTDSFTTVSYLRLLTQPASYVSTSSMKSIARGPQSFIFASSSIQPQDEKETAILTQHDGAHYAIMLDLSQPISLSSVVTPSASASAAAAGTTAAATDGGSGIAQTTSTERPRSSRDMILIAHAVFASLAFLVITPIAILVPRYFRNRTWFPIHAALQITSFLFIIIAFALAVKGTELGFQSNFFDGHTRLGLAIFILVTIQVAGGATAHRTKGADLTAASTARFPTLAAKSPVRFLHMASGVAIVVLGWIQVESGFDEWSLYSDSQTEVPRGVKVVYIILVIVWTLLYFFGWAREYLSGASRLKSVPEEGQNEKAPSDTTA